MNVIISRQYNPDSTKGRFLIVSGIDLVYSCYTLELPWKDNQRNLSCIPEGDYTCWKIGNATKGTRFKVLDVKDREDILLHSGNFTSQTKGCILVGSYFSNLNNDKVIDIARSRMTLNKLLTLLPDEFNLKIM